MVSCPISYWLLCGLLVFLVINMVMIFRCSQNWWSAQVKIKHPGWSKMVENCLTECNLLDKKRGDGGCKLLKNWEKVENVKQVQMRAFLTPGWNFWHRHRKCKWKIWGGALQVGWKERALNLGDPSDIYLVNLWLKSIKISNGKFIGKNSDIGKTWLF